MHRRGTASARGEWARQRSRLPDRTGSRPRRHVRPGRGRATRQVSSTIAPSPRMGRSLGFQGTGPLNDASRTPGARRDMTISHDAGRPRSSDQARTTLAALSVPGRAARRPAPRSYRPAGRASPRGIGGPTPVAVRADGVYDLLPHGPDGVRPARPHRPGGRPASPRPATRGGRSRSSWPPRGTASVRSGPAGPPRTLRPPGRACLRRDVRGKPHRARHRGGRPR